MAPKQSPEDRAQVIQRNIEGLRTEMAWVRSQPMRAALKWYDDLCHHPTCTDEIVAELGRLDRFFLLTHLLRRVDAAHPWLYARCREVEAEPDGHIDLWARDHYKSTLITFAGSIQEIIRDPEITIGIFSHVRPIAKAFLSQIKQELERNDILKRLYPEVFWSAPEKEAPVWSLDGGIVVRRQTNPKEATVEAHGMVDGQPTAAHFRLLIFDDVVVRDSVNTPDQILKTTEAWELCQNLGSARNPRDWHVGTRYHFADTYGQIIEREARKVRVYPATDDGTPDGKPVFLRTEVWEKKKKESSASTIAAQQLLNPLAGGERELQPEWIRPYEIRPRTLNVYILGDYAGSRKSTGSSNTAIVAIGVDAQLNKYLLGGACHKMDLEERWRRIRDIRKYWIKEPGVQIVQVGYERFGAQSDIEHFQAMMRVENEFFDVQELNWPRDGDVAKDNRIRRLIPDLRNWRFFFPYVGDPTRLQRDVTARNESFLVAKQIKAKNEDEKIYDLVEYLKTNEYQFFPYTTKKDMLDAMSRIYDMQVVPPQIVADEDVLPPVFPD